MNNHCNSYVLAYICRIIMYMYIAAHFKASAQLYIYKNNFKNYEFKKGSNDYRNL